MMWKQFKLDTTKNQPLYLLLADRLRQMIASGKLTAGEKLPSSRELQKQLCVSAITIETGLNLLVEEGFLFRRPRCGTFVAEQLPGSAGVTVDPPGCVYVVLSNMKGLVGTYWWIVISELEQRLRKAGYRICIHQHEAGTPMPSELAGYRDCAGMVLCGYNSRAFACEAKARGIPVVLIGSLDEEGDSEESLDMVTHNDRERAMISATHLLDLGHRRIAAVTAPPHSQFAAKQKQGIMDAVAAYGLPHDTVDFFDAEGLEYEDGVPLGYELFCRRNRPTAVFAGNDLLAYGIIAAAGKLGLAVPDDFSIIGCGGIRDNGVLVKPVLTTTVSKPQESARMAVEKLLRQVAEPGVSGGVTVIRIRQITFGETTVVCRSVPEVMPMASVL
ncbi:MAG: GntR family transcriptional regulator [Lentisphaeria bacterium]|nr:GntR family transcriptional regulator [Lentisphaeria bacterium]